MNLCCWGKAKPGEEVRVSNNFFGSTTPECCHKASVTFKKPLSEQNLGGSHITRHICFVENSLLCSPPLKICSLKTQGMFDFSRPCVSEFCIISDVEKRTGSRKSAWEMGEKKEFPSCLPWGLKHVYFHTWIHDYIKTKEYGPAETTTWHPILENKLKWLCRWVGKRRWRWWWWRVWWWW